MSDAFLADKIWLYSLCITSAILRCSVRWTIS